MRIFFIILSNDSNASLILSRYNNNMIQTSLLISAILILAYWFVHLSSASKLTRSDNREPVRVEEDDEL